MELVELRHNCQWDCAGRCSRFSIDCGRGPRSAVSAVGS